MVAHDDRVSTIAIPVAHIGDLAARIVLLPDARPSTSRVPGAIGGGPSRVHPQAALDRIAHRLDTRPFAMPDAASHSAAMCAPFSATDRRINSTRSTHSAATTAADQKTSK